MVKNRIVLFNKKWTFYVLCFLLLLMPLELIFSSATFGLFVIIALVSARKKDFKMLFMPHKVYLVLLYFLIVFVGILYTNNREVAIGRIIRQLPLLIFPIGIVLAKIDGLETKKLKRVFVFGCLFFCAISLITLLYNYSVNYELRYQYNFVQLNMYHFHFPYDTLYLNIAYVFLLFGTFSKSFKRVCGVVFFIIIFLFGVRLGMATFILLSFVYLILNIRKLLNKGNIIVALVIIILIGSLLTASPYVKDKYYDTLSRIGLIDEKKISEIGKEYHKLDLRKALWQSSVEVIKGKPIFGYGTAGEIKNLGNEYVNQGLKNRGKLNSHNQYLSTTLQHGFVGLGMLVFILGYTFFCAVKNKKTDHVLVILVLAAGFMTESFLIRQKGVMVFTIFITLFLNYKDKVKKSIL